MQQLPLLVIFIVSTLGYIVFLAEKIGWKAEIIPFFTIFSQLVVLYFASLVGALLAAAVILHTLGCLLLLIVIFKNHRSLLDLVRKHASPGIVLFLLLIPILWFQTRPWHFIRWDEFSHWGLILKEISLTNKLPGVNTAVHFIDYPPGTTLYQYFVIKLLGYREGSAYFAHGLMIIAPFVSLSHNYGWKKWYLVLEIYCAAFLLLHFLGYGFNVLYVDALLGILFGATVVYFVTKEDLAPKSFVYIFPMLISLPLIKQSGLFFSFFVLAIIFASELIKKMDRCGKIRDWDLWKFSTNWRRKTAWVFSILAVIAVPLVTSMSWGRHIATLEQTRYEETPYFSEHITLRTLYRPFSPIATERDTVTLSAFTQAIEKEPIGAGKFSTKQILAMIFMMTILYGLVLYARSDDLLQIYFGVHGVMLFCFLLYAIGLLFLYLFYFYENEGVRVASFDRYMGSFLIGWGIVFFGFISLPSQSPRKFTLRTQRVSLVFLSTLLCGLFLETPIQTYLFVSQEAPIERANVATIAQAIEERMELDSSVYHVWQNTNGYEHYVMRYELVPRYTQFWGWSLGVPYDDKDIWTTDEEPVEWLETLQEKYDYVLISKSDSLFWERYGGLFDDYVQNENQPQLFQVTANGLIQIH
jgi:hypothetical protein